MLGSLNAWICQNQEQKFNQSAKCMISKVKFKNAVCSQEMYGNGSLLVLITPFIEYILKVTIKIIFHHSKTVCKIYKLSIQMAVRGGGSHTKSYVLLFISQEKSEFSQEKVEIL